MIFFKLVVVEPKQSEHYLTNRSVTILIILFSVYLDNLLQDLKSFPSWFGSCEYADDFILLATKREVNGPGLPAIWRHNLVFSIVPSLSKTKCVYFCARYHGPVQLNGKDLPPWPSVQKDCSQCWNTCIKLVY
jgi:hypothetical protein